jgi:outer membrane protein
MQAAERAAQVARDRYAAGAATQIDVIQAERDLFGAEVSQTQARTELASARVALKISAGLPLQVE